MALPTIPTFDSVANNCSTLLKVSHAAGDGVLNVWDSSRFVAPTRVVCTSGSTPYTEQLLSILQITAVDHAANTLTVGGALEGTSDVGLPARTRVEIRETAGMRGQVTDAILALAAGDNPGSVPTTFVHTQMSPAATWVIAHLLDRYPSVTIVDSAGTVVIGEVHYDSTMQVTCSFSAGFSGFAYLN